MLLIKNSWRKWFIAAAENGCVIAYTLVIEELAEFLEAKAREAGVITVDIIGPLINAIKKSSGEEPRREPLLRKMDEVYFRRVEAIEFAVRYDDGKIQGDQSG